MLELRVEHVVDQMGNFSDGIPDVAGMVKNLPGFQPKLLSKTCGIIEDISLVCLTIC